MPPPPPVAPRTFLWVPIADSAQAALLPFYKPQAQIFSVNNQSVAWCQYWPTAHALDVLVDQYLRSPSPSLKDRMAQVVAGLKASNGNTYINFYYDDMEWMALAALRAYGATNELAYKDLALLLWADIKNGWSSDLGGGIWWRKDNSSKNAPSNLPAAILAARLYRQFGNAADLQWAQRIYTWQKTHLYEPSSGWVQDNITAAGVKNTTWRFTYNQGTFIGAALELYLITGQQLYLDDALQATDYTLNSGQLTNASLGILKDEGGADGGLFKGIFVRYLTRLMVEGNLPQTRRAALAQAMLTNARTLWLSATKQNVLLFGSNWAATITGANDFTNQLSGVMLMECMAELSAKGLLN